MRVRKKETFVRLDKYEPADVEHLWEPYVPLKYLTMIDGDPDLGKTWVALSLAAAVSTGGPMPGQKKTKRGKVLIMSAEDEADVTIRPRIDILGGNARNMYFEEEKFVFDTTGIKTLRRYMKRHKPLLVIVDPIVAYLVDVDWNNSSSVRPKMRKLAELASEFKCAIVLVRHLNKSTKEKSIYRGLGSIDIMAAARSGLLVDNDLIDPDGTRAVMHHKHNVSHEGATMLYRLPKIKERPGSRLEWLDFADYNSREYHERKQRPQGRPNEKANDAESFLKAYLNDGPRSTSDIKAATVAANLKWRTLTRVKSKLKIKSKKTSGGWVWRLP